MTYFDAEADKLTIINICMIFNGFNWIQGQGNCFKFSKFVFYIYLILANGTVIVM